jgi:hypothetical protein
VIRCPRRGSGARQKVSDVLSFGQFVPWTMRPLDNASFRRCVPWTMCPLDVVSLTDVSCHRAESKGFVTIYECNVCPAAPLKSYDNLSRRLQPGYTCTVDQTGLPFSYGTDSLQTHLTTHTGTPGKSNQNRYCVFI